jgi:hypothetical protein
MAPATVMFEHKPRGRILALLCAITLCSCGSSSSGPSGAPTVQGSYPAFKPDIGRLVDKGGAKLTSPKVVTVTWTSDANESAFEDFGDKIGASAYWRGTLGEYGIGPASSGAGNHVRLAGAPMPTISPDTLDSWIIQQVADPKTSGWPAYDPNTVYVIYVPTTTQLSTSGPYHSELAAGSNLHVPYVVVDENDTGGRPVVDAATSAASHEIAEAATNPHLLSDNGVYGFDDAHVAWQLFSDGYGAIDDPELGDLCDHYGDAFFKGTGDLPYSLQRLWSNKSAAAGHNPCTPVPSDPYYNVSPLGMDTFPLLVDNAPPTPPVQQTGIGYKIQVGGQKTFDVGYFSDAPLAPWTLTAVEGDGFAVLSGPSHLSFSIKQGQGSNGDQDSVTVTVQSPPSAGNAILMTIVSRASGLPFHSMPVLIGAF